MSKIGRIIWKDLDNIENWQIDQYTTVHKPSGLGFWVANGGFFFIGLSRGKYVHVLGLVERHILWRKYKRMIRRDVVARYFHKPK